MVLFRRIAGHGWCVAFSLTMLMAHAAFAQGLLPNGQQQFVDANGAPLAAGQVFFYIPGTTTAKTTWQDPLLSVPNTNPVVLNAAGRAVIWGSGQYREVLYDVNGNLIWDQSTSATTECATAHSVRIGEGPLPDNCVALGTNQLLVGQSAGDPVGEGLSLLLDQTFGSTQGSLLYRDTANWNALGPGTAGYYLQTQGIGADPTWAVAPASGLIGIQTFCASGCTSTGGTYTPDAGTTSVIVEIVGGGASGGGCVATSTTVAVASGGSSGGFLRFAASSGFSGVTVTVGNAGAAPSAGNNNGNDGTSSAFGSWTAAGSVGGQSTAYGTGGVTATTAAPATNTTSTGTVLANITSGGLPGLAVYTTSSNYLGQGGGGGSNPLGFGGQATASNTSQALAGDAGSGWGSGGSGAVCTASGSSAAGGAGAPGRVNVYEYAATL